MEQITIDRLGHQGDGVAKGEDDIFVPFTLPGEVVEITADGELHAVLQASAERIEPVCKHFGICGGCSVQHGSDKFIASWKVDVVRRALSARGIDMTVGGIATSPPRTRRRAVFGGRRTRKGITVGFHQRGTNNLIEIEECFVIDPKIFAAIPALHELTAIGASRTAAIRLSVTLSAAGLDVVVDEAHKLEPKMLPQLAEVAVRHELARLTWNDEVIVSASPPVQRMGKTRIVPSPGAFLQATPHGQAALVATVKQAVGNASRVIDLFAGCGTFALPLAENAEVLAVENDGPMLSALELAWRRTDGALHRITTDKRDLFRRPLLSSEMKGYDAVVVDPPRVGAAAQVAELALSDIKTIAFVSCNPVTFARDAEVLVKAGYTMGPVRVIDQFRWSPHVELAVTFTR